MGQITSSIGLVSGINTGQIIDQLMAINSEPVTLLQTRITSNQSQQQAYSDLETDLSTLQSVGMALERPTTFLATNANSSDSSVLTATTTPGAPQGSYQFQVAQLVSAQQSISNGYTSTSAPLQAGTISLEMGGGNLGAQTALSDLNGGGGVNRGQFRITDRSGNSTVIDTSSDLTLDDVVKQINTSLNISVSASIRNNHLVLSDTSTGTGTLAVQDLAGGTSAQDLGIAGSTNGSTLTGTAISYLGTNTALSALNDGLGVRVGNGAGDFTIKTADGTSFTVNLAGARTMGDVLNAINTAGGGAVKASLATGATGVTLSDQTSGAGSFSVTDINGSNAAEDLGIRQSSNTGSINGSPVIAGLDTVLLRSLKGGAGIPLGQVSIQDRSGGSATVDLSGAKTVQDVLDTINQTTGIHVTASLNAAGNGIQIRDSSGGSGNLVIADANGGSTASSLGIAGTFGATQLVTDGGDLHLQFVGVNTLLSDYNGGKGVTPGSFKIANAAGATATIDLSKGTFNTIGDVIKAINAKNIGVTASINANGNGILLTDTSGGAGTLAVTGLTGTTAKDLNILGPASGKTIDGGMQKTVQVNAGDTLASVQAKIQALGFGVSASIINDGSSQSPYRLSITSLNSGKAGRVIIDGGTTGLQIRNLVEGQDAAVFVGGGNSSQPLLVTSSTNQITGVIPGVTLSLQAASSKPVTLSITPDASGIQTQLQSFTDTFNSLADKLTKYTHYDTTTNQGGVLLGDQTAQLIQEKMYAVFQGVVQGAGQYRTLGDMGLTLDDSAKVTFDPAAFNTAYANDPNGVKNLFTQATTGLGAVLDKSITSLVDPVSGAITLENNTLANKNRDFQTQITQLNSLLADQRTRLEQQFANMESVLAGLQSQQAALGSISGFKPTASSGSASSGSASASSSGSSGSSSSGGSGASAA